MNSLVKNGTDNEKKIYMDGDFYYYYGRNINFIKLYDHTKHYA